MKITVLANRDIHSNIALNLLRPLWDRHDLTIMLSESVGVPATGYEPPDELRQLRFLEQQLFNYIVAPLAETQPDDGERYLTFSELAGGDRQTVSNINAGDGLQALEDSAPDLIISIRFGLILREAAIAVPGFGVLNLHSGLLPIYKGILTTLHALAAGEPEVGCTLHLIDSPSIDAGPIVDAASIDVDRNRSLLWHVLQLYPPGCELIMRAVESLAAGESLRGAAQDNDGQPYFSLPNANDFRRLRDAGFRVWDSDDLVPVYRRFVNGGPAGGEA